MRFALVLLAIVSIPHATTWAQGSTSLLDQNDAWLLVMNTPDLIEVECHKGCPDLEFHAVGKRRVWATATNKCPSSGNGTLGVYTVDLSDGRVWSGIDPVKLIDSDRLRRLRQVLLSRRHLQSAPAAR
jgi:hypothetical protein